MPEEQRYGRRPYDGGLLDDHDLLVRIDERLTGHILAVNQDRARSATEQALTEQRLGSLESWRSEMAGAERANARFVAIVVAASAAITAIAVKVAERVLT